MYTFVVVYRLVILTIETLTLMMRETEILPARMLTLTSSKGRPIMDLVTVLTCFPEMPHKYIPPSSQAAALLNTSKSDQWETLVDADLSKLMQDFTKVSTALLADLILIAQQVGKYRITPGWKCHVIYHAHLVVSINILKYKINQCQICYVSCVSYEPLNDELGVYMYALLFNGINFVR